MPEVCLIIPTRNEAETICECIERSLQTFKDMADMGLSGEVLVVDSSHDRTADIAASCGARVIRPEKLGYGNAYLAGLHFEAFGASYGLSDPGRIKKMISYHSLEKELFVGIILVTAGVLLGLNVLMNWGLSGFGALDAASSAMMAMILSILGIQTVFSGMFISLLLLNNSQQD